MSKKKIQLLKWILILSTGLALGAVLFFVWLSRLDSKFENSQAACQVLSECVMMKVGACGRIQAIHLSNVDLAKAYTKCKKLVNSIIQCSPELPFNLYEPLCLNQKCQVVVKNSHLFLEVPSQPVAGQPFLVGIGFQANRDGEIEVEFQFPRDVRIVNGQATWSRPVEAMKDYAFWVEMQVDTPGTIYLSGLARIKDHSQDLSPLVWGDYFTVVSDNTFTPHPVGERVLATPTELP